VVVPVPVAKLKTPVVIRARVQSAFNCVEPFGSR
jgi:hypothetical protein